MTEPMIASGIAGADVVAEARRWLGTPFHHQGRLLGVGVDCLGVVVCVAHALGIDAPDRANYGLRPDSRDMEATARRVMAEVPLDAAAPGDVLLLTVDGMPQHIGFVTDLLGGLGLLHAHAGSRRVVEHGLDEQWRSRVVAAFRLPGVG